MTLFDLKLRLQEPGSEVVLTIGIQAMQGSSWFAQQIARISMDTSRGSHNISHVLAAVSPDFGSFPVPINVPDAPCQCCHVSAVILSSASSAQILHLQLSHQETIQRTGWR
jgi:hypothetical protein